MNAKSPRRKSIRLIGSFQILGQIGQGSFSHVNLAKNLETNEIVCVKILSKRSLKKDAEVEALRKEVQILSEVKHENVVKFFDFLEDINNYYIFMEYCEGDRLQSLIERPKLLSVSFVKTVFKQIIDALVFLHEKGIAHRDLKPDNIIVDHDDHVKIIDFGLSTDQAFQLRETYCGSLAFASPECVRHIPYSATKSDVWSAGLILYSMLVGGLPWKSRDVMGISREISFEDVQIPFDVPAAPSYLLKQILKKDPAQRPTAKEISENPWLNEPNFTPSLPTTPNKGVRNKARSLKTSRSNTHPIFFPIKKKGGIPLKQTVKRFVTMD